MQPPAEGLRAGPLGEVKDAQPLEVHGLQGSAAV